MSPMNQLTEYVALQKRRGQGTVSRSQIYAAGFSRELVDAAVEDGYLRSGVTGVWLPEAPDPGAQMVMKRAMKGKKEDKE